MFCNTGRNVWSQYLSYPISSVGQTQSCPGVAPERQMLGSCGEPSERMQERIPATVKAHELSSILTLGVTIVKGVTLCFYWTIIYLIDSRSLVSSNAQRCDRHSQVYTL